MCPVSFIFSLLYSIWHLQNVFHLFLCREKRKAVRVFFKSERKGKASDSEWYLCFDQGKLKGAGGVRGEIEVMIMHQAAFSPYLTPNSALRERIQPLQKGGSIKRPKKMWDGGGCEISLLVNLK